MGARAVSLHADLRAGRALAGARSRALTSHAGVLVRSSMTPTRTRGREGPGRVGARGQRCDELRLTASRAERRCGRPSAPSLVGHRATGDGVADPGRAPARALSPPCAPPRRFARAPTPGVPPKRGRGGRRRAPRRGCPEHRPGLRGALEGPPAIRRFGTARHRPEAAGYSNAGLRHGRSAPCGPESCTSRTSLLACRVRRGLVW